MNNDTKHPSRHHLLLICLLTMLLISVGTIGYTTISHYPPVDAFYMTVITLTTVGFGEVWPLNMAGRLFTVGLIIAGCGLVAYNIMYFGQVITDANWIVVYRRRKVQKKLAQISNHYIICGYGQMGKIIVQQLQRHQVPVIVIESDEKVAMELCETEIPHLLGDATEEDRLMEAGIQRAAGLVATAMKDTDNVFIVLTARDLNKKLFISARASTPGTEKRLLKAGADRVVSPYASGALRIAHNILRPTVTDFLELALSGEGMELSLEELHLIAGTKLIGKALRDSGIRSDFNLIIVAIKRSDGQMIYNPSPDEVLQEGDILIAIGPKENLSRFTKHLYGEHCNQIHPCITLRA